MLVNVSWIWLPFVILICIVSVDTFLLGYDSARIGDTLTLVNSIWNALYGSCRLPICFVPVRFIGKSLSDVKLTCIFEVSLAFTAVTSGFP